MAENTAAATDAAQHTDKDGFAYSDVLADRVERSSECYFEEGPVDPTDDGFDCGDTAPPGHLYCPYHARHLRAVRGEDGR